MGTALVVGFGSIGKRHVSILRKMGISVKIFSRRKIPDEQNFPTLEKAINEIHPEYLVIANETSEHFPTLKIALANEIPKILIEKPIFSCLENYKNLGNCNIRVAYNLRFHPLLEKIRTEISNQSILSVQVYVGQYLPNWRLQKEYYKSYSVSKKLGGGVLRDLSHELDYLNWIFGPWQSLTAIGGHFSSLKGDSDDLFNIIFKMKRCPAISLQMNYFDRRGRREIILNTDQNTFFIDLVSQTFCKDNTPPFEVSVDRDQTYIAQHKDMIENQGESCCSVSEATEILRMIHMVEESNLQQKWISI